MGAPIGDPDGGDIGDVTPGRRRRRTYGNRDLTKGSIPGNLWFLAWPQALEGVFNALDQVADLFWAGQAAGFQAIAGLGAAQAYSRFVVTSRNGLDIGMQAMLSRAIGSGQMALANHIVLQALTLNAILALVIAVAGMLLSEVLLQILGVSDGVIQLTLLYLQLQFVSSGAQAFRMASGAALQGSGDALTPMKATMLARVVHLVGSPLLIFGVAGLPEMGIAGASAANILAQSVGASINFYALFTGHSRLKLTLRGYATDFPLLCKLVRIGLPASGTQMERGLAELMLARLVTPFGDVALAAYSLTRRLEQLTFMGSMGVGRASGVIVGQNLGAGDPLRAKQTLKWALVFMLVSRGAGAGILLLFPAFFVGIFGTDPEFLAAAVVWVQIQAIAGLFMGLGQVFQQSFNVAGDTVGPLVVTFLSMWVFELPGAYILAYMTPLGQFGIPLAITAAMIVRALLYGRYYFTDRWLRAKVL